MCVGPELALALAAAGTAAQVGGNYMQTQQNNASNQAMTNAKNAALQEGLAQQKQNQAQASDVLNQTLNKFQAPQQQQDLGALVTDRTNKIADNVATTPMAAPDANIKSAPTVVQSDLASKMGKVAGYGAQQGGALAKTGATGDQFLNNGLKLNDSGLNLNTISNFAQGQLGVNKLKQTVDASNARKSPSGFGNALSTIGGGLSLAGMGAGAGAGLGDLIFGSSALPTATGAGAGAGLGSLY